MKIISYVPVFFAILVFGCTETDSENIDSNNLSVEKYINLLKKGKYKAMGLPSFTHNDIPELLKYRNNKQIITNFPINPFSSFVRNDCKLGIYILWTIESIRAVANNKEKMILRFPSQNPILAERNSDRLSRVYNDISHKLAAKAYFDWWHNNKIDKNFKDFKHIDPLAQTDYKWN